MMVVVVVEEIRAEESRGFICVKIFLGIRALLCADTWHRMGIGKMARWFFE